MILKTCARCRDCQRAYFYSWQKENHERHKIRSREYYLLHKAAYKVYRQTNWGKIATYQKRYRKFNSEYLNASRRLKRKKIRAKAAWDAAKGDLQQIEESDVLNAQLRLVD